jgi:hypothetical protein
LSSQPIQLSRKPAQPAEREKLVRRAKLLARLGLGWHAIEAVIAIGAGILASSIALVGFGADSFIGFVAGIVLLWRFVDAANREEADEELTEDDEMIFELYDPLFRAVLEDDLDS